MWSFLSLQAILYFWDGSLAAPLLVERSRARWLALRASGECVPIDPMGAVHILVKQLRREISLDLASQSLVDLDLAPSTLVVVPRRIFV